MGKRKSVVISLLVIVISMVTVLTSCQKKSYQFMDMLGLKTEDIKAIHYSVLTGESDTTHIYDTSVSKRVDRLLSNLNSITFTKDKNLKNAAPATLRVRFFTEIPNDLMNKGDISEEELKKCKYVEYLFDKGFKKHNGVKAKTIEGYYKASSSPITLIHNAD